MYFVIHPALNIKLISKTQKAEGFWQSSKIFYIHLSEIALWYLSQHQGGVAGGSAVGMDVQMAQRGAICQAERKIPRFCILCERLLYDRFGVLDGCHETDSKATL